MTLLHSTFVVCGKVLKLTDVKTIDSKEEFLKIVLDINRREEVYSFLIYHAYDLCLEMILCISLIKTNFIHSMIISLIQLPFLVTPMYIRLMEKNTHLTEKVSYTLFLSLWFN